MIGYLFDVDDGQPANNRGVGQATVNGPIIATIVVTLNVRGVLLLTALLSCRPVGKRASTRLHTYTYYGYHRCERSGPNAPDIQLKGIRAAHGDTKAS